MRRFKGALAWTITRSLKPKEVESRTNLYNLRSLIYAENLDAISIVGRGTLDGNGAAFKDPAHDGRRPLILRVIDCRDVLVENIQMQNSGFWNQHYLACKRVRLQACGSLTIRPTTSMEWTSTAAATSSSRTASSTAMTTPSA